MTAGAQALVADLWRREQLDHVLDAWTRRHPSPSGEPVGQLDVVAVELLDDALPMLVSVLGATGGRAVHAVIGLRAVDDECRPVHPGEDIELGVVDSDAGLLRAVDALVETELAVRVFGALTGITALHPGGLATTVADGALVVALGDRLGLTAFTHPWPDGDPGVELLVALDNAGFNHLAAPVARWRHSGMDLGVVQERAVGMAGGWALALASLRDLYASRQQPDRAGGDFAFEARGLGTMAARMHLALADIYGLEVLPDGSTSMRTHGDLHLGRSARTDHGWILVDASPGGCAPGTDVPTTRSPVVDLADLVWSLRHVAFETAGEREPAGVGPLHELAFDWVAHNTAALVRGYRTEPEIDALVPETAVDLAHLVRVLAAERARSRAKARS